jgi:hypothetical protein
LLIGIATKSGDFAEQSLLYFAVATYSYIVELGLREGKEIAISSTSATSPDGSGISRFRKTRLFAVVFVHREYSGQQETAPDCLTTRSSWFAMTILIKSPLQTVILFTKFALQ